MRFFVHRLPRSEDIPPKEYLTQLVEKTELLPEMVLPYGWHTREHSAMAVTHNRTFEFFVDPALCEDHGSQETIKQL